MQDFAISTAEIADIAAIRRLADEGGLEKWTGEAYSQEILSETGIVLVSRQLQGELAGFIAGRVVPGISYDRPDAEIYNMSVMNRFRRRGIGYSLLGAFLDLCSPGNVRTIWLEVRASNGSAIQFYEEKARFAVAGVRKGFYRNPSEDALLMKLTLPPHIKNAENGLDDKC